MPSRISLRKRWISFFLKPSAEKVFVERDPPGPRLICKLTIIYVASTGTITATTYHSQLYSTKDRQKMTGGVCIFSGKQAQRFGELNANSD